LKIVVFGASGFVGRNVVDRLSGGHDVLAADIAQVEFPQNVEFRKTDITDMESVLEAVKGSDAVVHLAVSQLTKSLDSPVLNTKVNIMGTLNVLEACRNTEAKKIIFSSASSLVGEVLHSPVDEKHPTNPKTPYAVSKLSCEHYIRVYHELYGIDHVTFRFFNLYGPYQYPQGGGLIPNIFRRILGKEPVTVFGDGSAVRDFIYIDDVVDFYERAIESEAKNELVNMGTGKGSTIMNVITGIGEVTGIEPNIEYKPERKGEIANFVADTTKLEKVFDSIPKIELKDGLERTYQWFKKECV
jgi:UDP-glucose 4-epimerase